MSEQAEFPWKIDRQLLGEPMTIGDRTIRLTARVTGIAGTGGGEGGAGGGGWLRIKPEAVLVTDRDGTEYQVSAKESGQPRVRVMVVFGTLIAAVSFLLMRVAGR